MNRFLTGYRLGLFLVGFMFASAALICFSAGSGKPGSNVSQPPGSSLLEGRPIGPFSLTRETNSTVSSDDLKSSVWLTAFTFTRCPSSCPRISTTLKGIQDQLAGSSVKIVSISVDPKHDTPEILKTYGSKFGADPARWWFLTGNDTEIFSLIQKSFLLSVAPTSPEQQKQGAEEVAHSDRIALVDKDLKLVRFFDSNSPEELKQLVAEARKRDQSGWIKSLPKLNATLNATSFIFLMTGWFLIRNGRMRAHAFMMLTCLAISGAFLSSYLTYHYFVGTVRFPGTGPIRSLYLSILLSHTVLAVALVPLIALSITRAIRKDFVRHKAIAQVTFPIWVYISITGVVIYLMLYQMNHQAMTVSTVTGFISVL